MKNSEGLIPTATHEHPLSIWDFIRFSVFLTVGVTIAMFVTAAVQFNVEAWAISAVLWFLAILAIWIGTLTVACLLMVPMGIWRLSKRLARKDAEKPFPQGRLWDRWIDGPEPS